MAKPDLVYVTASPAGSLFAETGLSSTHDSVSGGGGGLGTFVLTDLPATVAATVGTVFATTIGTLTITGATSGQIMFVKAAFDPTPDAVTIVDSNGALFVSENDVDPVGTSFYEIRSAQVAVILVFSGTKWYSILSA